MFDPKNNINDRETLEQLVANSVQNVLSAVQRHRGTLKINDKEYRFSGLGEWTNIYIDTFLSEMSELRSIVRKYSKSIRYDLAMRRLADIIKEKDDSKLRGQLESLLKDILTPDPVMQKTLDEVEADMKRSYNMMYEKVLKRLVPGIELDEDAIALVTDALIEHVTLQREAAVGFLDILPELSMIVYDNAAKMNTDHPQK